MTEILQGRFTQASTAVAQDIGLRFDPDWMVVTNLTIADANQTSAIGVEYKWQRGYANDRGLVYYKSNAANAANLTDYLASGGFQLINTSLQTTGAATAQSTDISNATPPVVTISSHGFVTGDVVRIYNATGAQQLGGMDFEVAYVGANTFSLRYMDGIVAAASPGAGSFARRVDNNPIYYPRRRFITKIIQATSGTAGSGNPAVAADEAIVTLSVTHGYQVGQKVRFVVPEVTATTFGMTQLDGVQATIIAIGDQDADSVTNTIRVNVDVSSFTAFAFPLTASVPFSPALIVPIGEDSAQAISSSVDLLSDATVNLANIVMRLGLGPTGDGTDGPAGAASDVMYWMAGKSFSVSNQ